MFAICFLLLACPFPSYSVTLSSPQKLYPFFFSFVLFVFDNTGFFLYFCCVFSTSTFCAFTAFFYFLVLLTCIAFDLSGPPYSLHWPCNKPNRYSCVKRYHYGNARRTIMHALPGSRGVTGANASYSGARGRAHRWEEVHQENSCRHWEKDPGHMVDLNPEL